MKTSTEPAASIKKATPIQTSKSSHRYRESAAAGGGRMGPPRRRPKPRHQGHHGRDRPTDRVENAVYSTQEILDRRWPQAWDISYSRAQLDATTSLTRLATH